MELDGVGFVGGNISLDPGLGRSEKALAGRGRGGGVVCRGVLVGAAVAHLGEIKGGVKDGEESDGDGDEGRVEDVEAGLVLHDVVAPAIGHFGDAVGVQKAVQVGEESAADTRR